MTDPCIAIPDLVAAGGLPNTVSGRREPSAANTSRADALFRAHQLEIYQRTDRMFGHLMLVQWFAGILFALWLSPLAWTGSASQMHAHVWAALLLGGSISLFPAALAFYRPGLLSTRYTIATAQMLMSALLIHLTGGRIETHFHVFGSLAFLAFYRDWRVLVPATIIVAVDHLLRGLYWPESVYGVVVASEWRWLEHAAWVVFEDLVLVMSCLRGTRELREIAERTAVLEQAHRDQARQSIELTELVARLRLSQQQVEGATRAKNEFVANMSHELRTPLNIITLYCELLQEQAEDERRSSDVVDLQKIRAASKHLLGLINGILDLSKIEAGRMELDIQTFEIRKAIEELIDTMQPIISQNENRLTVTYEGQLGAMDGDLTKTRQILFNLLSNAAKFTSRGSITLRVSRGIIDGVEQLELRVEDTGIGVTEEQKARLFRPFAQADTSISRKYGGTGLGLALVWRFCQLMGGSVTVDGQPGGGACFTVCLPVKIAPRSAAAIGPAPEAALPAA